jgi:hypothetical protein
MYVVKGTVWVQSRDLATFVPYTLNVIGFAQTGILINLIASGGGFFAEQVAGFMVEVTEIRAG